METKNKTSLLSVVKPQVMFWDVNWDEKLNFCKTLKFYRYIVKITLLSENYTYTNVFNKDIFFYISV